MPDRTNHDRAQSARLALDPFTIENYSGTPFDQLHPDDQQGAIVELIGDLFHLADEMGMSRGAILRTARDFYAENKANDSPTLSVVRQKTEEPISYVERVRKKQAQQQERGV